MPAVLPALHATSTWILHLNLAVVGHASEVGISCVLSTIHVADSASDEKFRGSLKRVVQNPLHPEAFFSGAKASFP